MTSAKRDFMNEMIKKVTNALDLRREILDLKYELESLLIERSACSATIEEEQEKLLIKYCEEGDQLNDEVNFHKIKYLFMKCSS
ncbi:hypothetical protein H5410_039761 [Solanum commersonii]|uniref:Uncharacterized protein n=1 Tax=Solanum commersonii TaxID=4109 RepID=A0A9J5XP26_SOLCO|nr:hypothetical protein H5410_039761 [Solanum commersonii]